jgi:hypothetical protein
VYLAHPAVSRRHATIEWLGPYLYMVAVCGAPTPPEHAPTLRVDGTPQSAVHLVPGLVVEVGAVALVAGSARTDQLRAGLARYIGFAELAQEQVDKALYAAPRRRHVAIQAPPGGGGLALARYLHDAAAPGNAWPFVVAQPRLLADPRALLREAQCGTLVVREDNLTAATAALIIEDVERDYFKLRLIVLTRPDRDIEATLGPRLRDRFVTVAVAPLSERRGDLPQLITETVAYHAQRVGATGPLLTADDFTTLTRLPAEASHDDLDSLIETLVCVRQFANSADKAGQHLGRDPSGIRKLLKRHRLPLDALAHARR